MRFVGELELEHAFVAGLEPSGEVELEQADLDFRLKPAVNLRAGMLLAPVGIITSGTSRRRSSVSSGRSSTGSSRRRGSMRGREHGTVGAGWQVSRVCDGAARRHQNHGGRGTARSHAKGLRVERS
jgi:hypothetical protein